MPHSAKNSGARLFLTQLECVRRTETSATLLTANVNKLLITRHEHAAQGQKSRSGAFCLIYKQIKRRHSKDLKFCSPSGSDQKKDAYRAHRHGAFNAATQERLARKQNFFDQPPLLSLTHR